MEEEISQPQQQFLALLRQIELSNNNNDIILAKQNFVEIASAIKNRTDLYCKGAPLNPLLHQLVPLIAQQFRLRANTCDIYRGLVVLSNLVLFVDQTLSERFFQYNETILLHLANFFTKITEINESSSTSTKFDLEFHVLALMAMLIRNAGDTVLNNPNNFSFIQQKKTFTTQLLALDFDEKIATLSEQRQREYFKIIGVLLVTLIRYKSVLRQQKLLNNMKIFLLQQLPLLRDNCTLSYYITCISQISSEVTFTDAELKKNGTIEFLLSVIAEDAPQSLLIGTLKVLKFFWQKNLIIQSNKVAPLQQLVKRLIRVFQQAPQHIAAFLAEIYPHQRFSQIMQENPEFVNVLSELVQKGTDQQAAFATQIFYDCLQELNSTQMFQVFANGLIEMFQSQMKIRQDLCMQDNINHVLKLLGKFRNENAVATATTANATQVALISTNTANEQHQQIKQSNEIVGIVYKNQLELQKGNVAKFTTIVSDEGKQKLQGFMQALLKLITAKRVFG